MGKPLVSICCIAFNHGKYIRQCLEEFVAQKTNFEIEILLFDDASSDNTQEIMVEFAKKYNNIKLFLQTENQWRKRKFGFIDWLFPAAQGKYIALCEGDDYWTDPYKLQKQVDILEQNPDCVACHHWHKITMRNKNGIFEEKEAPKRADDGYLLLEKADIGEIFSFKLRPQSRTMMFRNIFNGTSFPDWFYKVKFGDIALCFMLGKFGKFYFMDEVMAAYRVHEGGVSSIFKNKKGYIVGNKEWIRLIGYAFQYYDYSYEQEALSGINVFFTRIRKITNNSIPTRIKLMGFVLGNIKAQFSFKKKLIN